jgi:lipopolysaccharide transport system ATP-binding protein
MLPGVVPIPTFPGIDQGWPVMSDRNLAFKVTGVSKVYRLGVKQIAEDSLGAVMLGLLRSPVKNYRKYRSLYNFSDVDFTNGTSATDPETILWALRDISFEVTRGETLGIIGRNGAGKSTLLKVLSRITHPTRGRIEIRGRSGSLLEVGTGFHQELTGRENVYLNGTVLGMKKREIDQKFDEIVEFSGVEKFLDTPVKRYSSGMRVRLAFAVAAHLEPEILIVDEVLAVGDAAFQRKCLDKMQDVGQEGRTVLFVSHNMAAVSRLCERGILLDEGRIIEDGPIHDVAATYLNTGTGTSAVREWLDPAKAPGGKVARLRSVRVISTQGKVLEAADIRKPVGLQMEYDVLDSGHVLLPHYYLYNEEGVAVFGTVDQDPEWRSRPRSEGRYVSTAWIPGNLLAEGTIYVNCNLMTLNPNILQFLERHAVVFQVVDTLDGDSARGDFAGNLRGVVRPLLEWETSYSSEPIATAAEG